MNIASVRLFLEVADAGSLSKVAARRQTVQSHLSRQISEFEAECGGKLFHRTGRGMALTELGERAAARLRAWLVETEYMVQEMRTEGGRLMGTVRVGILPSAAHPLMTHVFQRLQAEHPGICLDIAEAQGAELEAMLDSGAVDLGVLFRYQRPAGGREILLSETKTYLVSRPGDPLTASPTLAFARLQGLRLILPRRPSHWREALDQTARSLGFTLDAVAEADSLTLQKELVANGSGIYSILGPYTFASELAQGRLQASLLVKPELVRHVTLAYPRAGKLSAPCRAVADAIASQVRAWGQSIIAPG